MDNEARAQIVYFSHGGGPLPILGDKGHIAMNVFMQMLPERLRKPKAILVISAHWEEEVVTLQTGKNPELYYDYYGFPKEAYEIKYPASGSPDIANKVIEILTNAGIDTASDDDRGFDHGLFIPLKMMYPKADIPCFQMSLLHSLNAREHIELGVALRPLLDDDILIVGSGFSFHNLSAFSFGDSNEPDAQNDEFQDWLIDTCSSDMSWEQRQSRLNNWREAPGAGYCHPRAEHLLPLHVCAALSGEKGEVIFDDYISGKRSLAFLWEFDFDANAGIEQSYSAAISP